MTTMEPKGRYYEGDGETPEDWYLMAEEAFRYLGVSRTLFYRDIWDTLRKYKLPTFRRKLFYRLSDLERVKQLRKKLRPE